MRGHQGVGRGAVAAADRVGHPAGGRPAAWLASGGGARREGGYAAPCIVLRQIQAGHACPPTHPTLPGCPHAPACLAVPTHPTLPAWLSPLQNPAFITLRKIEAAREIAATVASSGNRVMLNADSLFLNLSDLEIMKRK